MNRAFSLLEVLIAMVVLGIATFALLMVFSGSLKLDEATQEEIEANAVLASTAERLKADSISAIIDRYHMDGLGAPPAGVAAESVRLTPAPGWSHPIRIQAFPMEDLTVVYDGGMEPDPADAGAVLHAKYATVAGQPEWGLPADAAQIDLNCDGSIASGVVPATNVQVLPVRITAKWISRTGGVNRIDRHLFIGKRAQNQGTEN